MTVHDTDMAAPSRRRRSGRSLPRSAAFWVVAGTTTAPIAAATRNVVAVLLEATIPNQEALGHPAGEPATRKRTAKKPSRG